MNPDPSSVLAGLGAAGLAALGALRRARRPTSMRPTAGQRLAEQGTDMARAVATAGGGVGRFAAGTAAGAVSVGGMAAAAALRGAGSVSTAVGGGVVALAGEAAARTGGLVLDGGLAITDLLRRRPARTG